MEKNQFVQSLQENQKVCSPFLVKWSMIASGKTGKPYMNLILMDKTGEIEGRLWEGVTEALGQVVKDAWVALEGRCQVYQGRKQIVIERWHLLREDEVQIKDYLPQSQCNVEELYLKLLVRASQLKDPFYRALAEALLKEETLAYCLKRAPAAKSIHHAYQGGLIEHIVSVTQVLDLVANHYGDYLNRDLLFLGGLLHDIGKIQELSYDKVTDYTLAGKLVGHLVIGIQLVTQTIQKLESQGLLPGPFPQEHQRLVEHIMVAHHGHLDFGSPREPQCLESLLVHLIDDLDSKINTVYHFMLQDQTPGRWTALHKHLNRYFYKSDAWLDYHRQKSST